ncbi:UDP-N-acetylglucosamine--LPS N-acetylglucosamine transferase [Collinsella sp. zg1085]|uniref:MGDG synthase family glycosyltransferase n=1 Tax=Collinsella sp. zg1085 TaxID=2844380 RepID=UPI001C0CD54D|nr:glycosyltransferase [Collinsella sp. zg1085]QWT17007.1 UDP-N-acetylglucosamine--LPS N-acetylglucosamine transferase [Collinsella sp. zg1085]
MPELLPAGASQSAAAPLITIMHASVGSGHKAAAHAIADAVNYLKGRDGVPENAVVEVIDILDFGRIHFDGNKTAASFTGAGRPIYDIQWRYTLTGRVLWGGGTGWSKVMFPAFNEYIRAKQPVAVICTHITAANVAVGARMITGIEYPIICVPTDYEVEGWWPHKETDLFCVATEFMAETLRPRKVEAERIRITGIPVRHGFTEHVNREACRDVFQLPQDKQIVLIMAGASLPQPYVLFRAAIEQTIPYLRRLDSMHFVFLPGRDYEYAHKLKALFKGMKLGNVSVFDYVDDMATLMQSSDLAILKSGGLTVTECLCAELPMVLVGKSYGQEKANTTLLTSYGASMHATTPHELVSTLERLHNNPEALQALLTNARALRKPHAAQDIVRATMELVGIKRDREVHFVEFYWGEKPAHVR